jgi:protein-S-isoprenylcysteine O-methyltransferase Ste14
MITKRRATTFEDGRPEEPASRLAGGLLRWDVAVGSAYARLANRPVARLAGRILAALVLTFVLAAKWQAIKPLFGGDHLHSDGWTDQALLLNTLLQIPFVALMILLVVIRGPQIRGTGRLSGMVVALSGTLLPSLLIYDSRSGSIAALAPLAALLLAAGMLWAIWSLTVLGRCFSMVPEVRGLVTSGPYRWVRHPIYLGEVTAVFGLLLPIISVSHVAIFAIFCGLQLWRTNYEEAGLAASFPEYGEYRNRTARLLPGLW